MELFLNRWLAIKAQTVAPKTIESYREMAAHAMRDLGQRPLKALTMLELQSFYTDLAQRPLSSRTVSYAHTVLKMALNDAVDWELIPHNPAAKIKRRGGKASRPLRIPTPEEVARLLEASQNTRWYALWAWLATTGTRLGEAIAFQWADINWDQQTATIWQAVSQDAGRRKLKKPKPDRFRTIALGARLVDILREHQQEQQKEREAAGDAWEDGGFVFVTRAGRWRSKRHALRAFKAALRAANLPESIRVHDLRHAMATQWLAASINPNVVKDRLGHSTVAFTLQKYGHVLPHEERAVVDPMEAVILPGPPSTPHPHEPTESSIPALTP